MLLGFFLGGGDNELEIILLESTLAKFVFKCATRINKQTNVKLTVISIKMKALFHDNIA